MFDQIYTLKKRLRVLELELLDRKVKTLSAEEAARSASLPQEEEESLEHRVHRLEYFIRCLFPCDCDEDLLTECPKCASDDLYISSWAAIFHSDLIVTCRDCKHTFDRETGHSIEMIL